MILKQLYNDNNFDVNKKKTFSLEKTSLIFEKIMTNHVEKQQNVRWVKKSNNMMSREYTIRCSIEEYN